MRNSYPWDKWTVGDIMPRAWTTAHTSKLIHLYNTHVCQTVSRVPCTPWLVMINSSSHAKSEWVAVCIAGWAMAVL